MKPSDRPKPLYRKVNTRAYGVRHHWGGEYRYHRHTSSAETIGMKQGVRRGLDYTPLFRFLLSNVGREWNDVYCEAMARLDREDPIFWLVASDRSTGKGIVGIGENSYYSGLYIDENQRLQIVAPEIGPQDLEPTCSCCTHTLNGKPFTRKYTGRGILAWPTSDD